MMTSCFWWGRGGDGARAGGGATDRGHTHPCHQGSVVWCLGEVDSRGALIVAKCVYTAWMECGQASGGKRCVNERVQGRDAVDLKGRRWFGAGPRLSILFFLGALRHEHTFPVLYLASTCFLCISCVQSNVPAAAAECVPSPDVRFVLGAEVTFLVFVSLSYFYFFVYFLHPKPGIEMAHWDRKSSRRMPVFSHLLSLWPFLLVFCQQQGGRVGAVAHLCFITSLTKLLVTYQGILRFCFFASPESGLFSRRRGSCRGVVILYVFCHVSRLWNWASIFNTTVSSGGFLVCPQFVCPALLTHRWAGGEGDLWMSRQPRCLVGCCACSSSRHENC